MQADPETMNKSIEIRAKPRGLLTKTYEHAFLGEKCRVSLVFVGGTNLKLVLDSLSAESKNILRFDIKMDHQSFERYFERVSDTKYENMGETLHKVIEVLSDDATEAGDLEEINEFMQQFGDMKVSNDEIEACRFKENQSEESFWESLTEMLSAAEACLGEEGFDSISSVTDPQFIKYVKFRVWEEGKRKDLTFIVEDTEHSEFKIYQKNLFETHGNAPPNCRHC